jgi:hypothetical protein
MILRLTFDTLFTFISCEELVFAVTLACISYTWIGWVHTIRAALTICNIGKRCVFITRTEISSSPVVRDYFLGRTKYY